MSVLKRHKYDTDYNHRCELIKAIISLDEFDVYPTDVDCVYDIYKKNAAYDEDGKGSTRISLYIEGIIRFSDKTEYELANPDFDLVQTLRDKLNRECNIKRKIIGFLDSLIVLAPFAVFFFFENTLFNIFVLILAVALLILAVACIKVTQGYSIDDFVTGGIKRNAAHTFKESCTLYCTCLKGLGIFLYKSITKIPKLFGKLLNMRFLVALALTFCISCNSSTNYKYDDDISQRGAEFASWCKSVTPTICDKEKIPQPTLVEIISENAEMIEDGKIRLGYYHWNIFRSKIQMWLLKNGNEILLIDLKSVYLHELMHHYDYMNGNRTIEDDHNDRINNQIISQGWLKYLNN